MPEATRYLTVEEAARLLHVASRTVRERVQRGLMAGVKVNARLVLIPQAEVEAWRGQGRLRPGRKLRQAKDRSAVVRSPPPGTQIIHGGDDLPPLAARLAAIRATIAGGRTFTDDAAQIIREERTGRTEPR